MKPADSKAPAGLVFDKAPKLGLDTTADGLDAYVSYFRRLGCTVTLDQELFDRHGKLQIFRFAARQSIRGGSRRVAATINIAKRLVTTSEDDQTSYSSKTKS